MSSLSLSLPLASAPPTSTTTKLAIGVLIITSMACIIHLASPIRLTGVLLVAIDNVENIYLEAIETGALSKSDVNTAAMLSSARSLQNKVSYIREANLRSALSPFGAVCGFFNGRSFAILKCTREVRALEARIEILKEQQLRAPNPLGVRIEAFSLRRRHTHASSSSKFRNIHL
ncbi:hypothetical protein C8R44DRAFT_854554 [Mycena epipterygia]|nr:hypothetical protein C8R44DRAFT_854554 [Mycena epipterygia]